MVEVRSLSRDESEPRGDAWVMIEQKDDRYFMTARAIGNAVDAKNYRLAIDDELLNPVLQRGFDNPWITPGPVIAVARDQPRAVAVALDPKAIAVIFDFVEPLRCVEPWFPVSRCRNRTRYSCSEDRGRMRNCEPSRRKPLDEIALRTSAVPLPRLFRRIGFH